ncbi:MAG: hypothetical protein IJO49_05135, partial [Clostridia bacterium]|nr:hypothetical protein [Clostridia bacterium]
MKISIIKGAVKKQVSINCSLSIDEFPRQRTLALSPLTRGASISANFIVCTKDKIRYLYGFAPILRCHKICLP